MGPRANGRPLPPSANAASFAEGFEDRLNFNERPLIVIWEVTQACDLACYHCRASAQPCRDSQELSTAEGKRLISEIAEMGAPIFVITGGDPLKRHDIYELVEHAANLGIRPALTPSATKMLTREALFELKKRGLSRLALSLDASTPEVHDGFRGVKGSWARTMEAMRWAHEAGLPLQVNTTVTGRNQHDLENIATLLENEQVVLWSVFFLVPTGRGKKEDLFTAKDAEAVFAKLFEISKRVRFHIKTTEGQHYRRYLLQQNTKVAAAGAPLRARVAQRAGVNDGKGFVFVSHRGEVFPSGFLPLYAGSVREKRLADIYRYAPLMQALRDPDCLKGKCFECEFRVACGGSRARAFAMTGDPFAQDPLCCYQPASMREMFPQPIINIA
jgi:radical SAM protein